MILPIRRYTRKKLQAVLHKTLDFKKLLPEEIECLWHQTGNREWTMIFESARELTGRVFGPHLRFFAPLYFSNFCVNDCLYCGFRRSNRLLKRHCLTPAEFLREAKHLWDQGHRTILLVAGEHPIHTATERIAAYLSELKRENLSFSVLLEIGVQPTENYRLFHEMGIKSVLLFQESYNADLYQSLHCGPKRDFDCRYQAMGRALEAGIENVGLGILLGLGSPWEDVLGLIRHCYELKEKFGKFPATLSFPRIRPAVGVSYQPSVIPNETFERLLAVVRLVLPTVGIVLSTRESPSFRNRLLELGIAVTHISAGCSTQPGGYALHEDEEGNQFEILDRRALNEMILVAEQKGYTAEFHF